MKEQWLAGVDLGGTSTKLAFISQNGEIIHKWQIPTDNKEDGKNIIKNIAHSLTDSLTKLGKTKADLAGIGMGVPGPVNYTTGVVYQSVNIGWTDDYPVKALLEKDSGLPVTIDNDANCAALGEMWNGSGAGAEDLILVTLGTGVGGGVIVEGRIVQGVNGAAGEIGHITCIPEGGAPCNCGKTGCLETIASATGIVRLANEKLKRSYELGRSTLLTTKEHAAITAKDVFDCARSGDSLCLEVIDEISLYLGMALANLGNTLNPQKIVIGGGVSKAGDILLNKVQAYFDRFAFPRVRLSTKLAIASLGNDAGVIGAARLVKNSLDN